MIKFFRRQFWLGSAFIEKYYQIILTSLIISIIFGLILHQFITKLPKQPEVIRIGIIGQYTNQSLPSLVKNILNSGLTKVQADQNIGGNLASTWSVGDDGKSYTFSLKPNLLWSNGVPIKAEDVVINIPDVNIQYPADDKITFILPQSFAPFPSVLTNPIISKAGLTAGNFQVLLSQNTNGVLTKVMLKSSEQRVNIYIFSRATQALTAYKLGELDAIYNYPETDSLNLSPYGQIKETTNFHQAVAIFFNNQDLVLKDKSVRQGIAYALKDKAFGFERALGPISLTSWAYNPLVKPYEYDPDKVSKLIQNDTNIELVTIPQYLSIAEKIKDQLALHRINLTIKVITNRPENYQLYLTLFEMPTDPDQYIFWHSSHGINNITKADDEKLDKDLEDGRRTIDQNERKKIYNNFQRTFAEELPALFLFYPKYQNLARHSITFEVIPPETAP